MSKILVDRELLERITALLEWDGTDETTPLEFGARCDSLCKELSDYIAQPAEAEGVDLVPFWVLFDATTPEPLIKKHMPEGVLAFFDNEEDARRAKVLHPGTDYKRAPYVRAAALSAVTAERDRLQEQVKSLQSDANSWQSGYDKGRNDGTKHRKIEIDQLRAEVEALREDAERFRHIERDCDSGMRGIYGDDWVEVIDGYIAEYAAMAAKEA